MVVKKKVSPLKADVIDSDLVEEEAYRRNPKRRCRSIGETHELAIVSAASASPRIPQSDRKLVSTPTSREAATAMTISSPPDRAAENESAEAVVNAACSVCKNACADFSTCASCSEAVCDDCQVDEGAIDSCDRCSKSFCQGCEITVAHCTECCNGVCESCGDVDEDDVCNYCRDEDGA